DPRLSPPPNPEHLWAEAEPHAAPRRTRQPGQVCGQLARPARDIEGRPSRSEARLARGAAAPAGVGAGGENRVDRVVAVRDPVEHRPDCRGVPLAQTRCQIDAMPWPTATPL